MKTLLLLSAAAAMLLGSCTTTRFASSEADGIYYIPRQAPIRQAQQEIPRGQGIAHDDHRMPTNAVPQQQHQEYTEYSDEQYYTENNQTYYEDSGNLRSTRHFYKDELMHDFSFASRIRRFHRPQYRWSYFDPWFTNMFWYTHNPNYFGVSIYHGFGSLAFHFPAFMHFQPGFYWYTWASPFHWYSPWHFSQNHWGWWSWNTHWSRQMWWGRSGFWGGWNQGYWAGFHDGFHRGWWSNPANFQYIYNSRDRSNYIYGHRGATGTVIGSGRGITEGRTPSFAERFEGRNRENPPVAPGTQTTPGRGVSERGRTMQPGGVQGGTATPGRAGGSTVGVSERGRTTQPGGGHVGQPATGRPGSDAENPRATGGAVAPRERESGRVQGQPREQFDGNRPIERDPQGGRQVRENPSPSIQRQPTERAPQSPPREMQPDRPQRQPENNQPTMRQPEQQRPRSYTPPSYQQPRSTREYRSPQMTRPVEQQRTETENRQRQQQSEPRHQQQNIQRQQERSQPSFSQPPRHQEAPRSSPPPRMESPQPSGGSSSPQQASPSGGSGRSGSERL